MYAEGMTGSAPASTSSLAFRTYRWEGFVFNVVCALYFVFLAPIIVDAANLAMRDPEAKVIWLGVLLALISLAEVWALPVKLRFVNQAVRDNGGAAGKAFYLWMFHTVISVILLFLVAGSFGVKITGDDSDSLPWWLSALIFVTVIKELVFLGFLWSGSDGEAVVNPKYARPKKREWIADAILVVYACVAYSATWSTITRGMGLEPEDPVMFVVNLFVASLLFLIFYLPLRIPYWIEEMAQVKTRGDWLRLVGSVLVVLIPALAFT